MHVSEATQGRSKSNKIKWEFKAWSAETHIPLAPQIHKNLLSVGHFFYYKRHSNKRTRTNIWKNSRRNRARQKAWILKDRAGERERERERDQLHYKAPAMRPATAVTWSSRPFSQDSNVMRWRVCHVAHRLPIKPSRSFYLFTEITAVT
jgi:hypothetical protein